MTVERHIIRPATPEDDAKIAALVVDGFMETFKPAFGSRLDRALPIMEEWIRLEHTAGGVKSLVMEGGPEREIAASIGIRVKSSAEEILSRGLWKALYKNLGLLRSMWATTLLSHPSYLPKPSEAYIERLTVSPAYRRQGAARRLLAAAEELGRDHSKQTAALHVSCMNEPALRLYESEGYLETSRQRSWITGHFMGVREWVRLQKDL